jgi:hypothetical protein
VAPDSIPEAVSEGSTEKDSALAKLYPNPSRIPSFILDALQARAVVRLHSTSSASYPWIRIPVPPSHNPGGEAVDLCVPGWVPGAAFEVLFDPAVWGEDDTLPNIVVRSLRKVSPSENANAPNILVIDG